MSDEAPAHSFASDNASGAHPEVLAALERANTGHALAYGNDPYTQSAVRTLRRHFGEETEVLFCLGGTGANVVGLASMLAPYQAVVCAESAHLNTDECAAPERFLGGKLLGVPTADGKLTPAAVEPLLARLGVVHHAQPRVVSISQATEWGTVYTPTEIRALAEFAHEHELLLHMDGARLANAAASSGDDLRTLTLEAGVDVATFGGTKNGLLHGDAVLLFRPDLAQAAAFHRKQSAQLASKMRFISAQFEALMGGDLWLRNAAHANAMARRLADAVRHLPGLEIAQAVQANAVFSRLPPDVIPRLRERFTFLVWDRERSIVRWMTSFGTTPEEVDAFAGIVREALD